MHDLLDVAEFIWLENQSTEKYNEILDHLYKPDFKKVTAADAPEFTREAEMAGFASMMNVVANPLAHAKKA